MSAIASNSSSPPLFVIEDDTTIPELFECLALMSRSPHTEGRTARCDALLDAVLVRRESIVSA